MRAYRDKFRDGQLGYGRAFLSGVFMSLVAAVIYATVWMLYLQFVMPDFMEQYTSCVLDRYAAEGATPEELAIRSGEMTEMAALYENPFLRFGITMMELFPVGVIASLICAGLVQIGRRK